MNEIRLLNRAVFIICKCISTLENVRTMDCLTLTRCEYPVTQRYTLEEQTVHIENSFA